MNDQGMGGAAVLGEVGHIIAKRDEDIEVWHRSDHRPPDQRLASSRPAHDGKAEGSAETGLSQRIHRL